MTTWYRECDDQLGTVFEDDEPDEEDDAIADAAAATAGKAKQQDEDGVADEDVGGGDNVGILSAPNRKYAKLSQGKEEESAFIIPEEKKEEEKRNFKIEEDQSEVGKKEKRKSVVKESGILQSDDAVKNGDALLVETKDENPAPCKLFTEGDGL